MKYTRLVAIFALIILLSGCRVSDASRGDMITTPKNNNIAIIGTWRINKYKIVNDGLANSTVLDNMIDMSIGFGRDLSFFNDSIATKPIYLSRKSSSSYFFDSNYDIDPKELNIDAYEIDIITVYFDEKLFVEFIPIGEEEGMVYYEGAFLYMERISTEEPAYLYKNEITSQE